MVEGVAGVGIGVRGESLEAEFAGGGEDAGCDFASERGDVSDDDSGHEWLGQCSG